MFEKEQELLKKVYDRKNVLVCGSWSLGKDLWIIQEENDLFLNHHFWVLIELILKFLSTIKWWWLMKTLIYIGLFLFIMLLVWWVTKPWRKKNKVQIAYSQIFLRLLRLLPRYISPYILIRLILKLIKKLKGLWMINLWSVYLK